MPYRRPRPGQFIFDVCDALDWICPYLIGTDLQVLQWWTEAFVTAITQSIRKMPYGIRCLARETLLLLRVCPTILSPRFRKIHHLLQDRFPDATEQEYAACIGRLVYYRLINPAIV